MAAALAVLEKRKRGGARLGTGPKTKYVERIVSFHDAGTRAAIQSSAPLARFPDAMRGIVARGIAAGKRKAP